MTERIIIHRRFCGPPDSGNGGYVCGVTAAFIDGTAEVTLRRPPPLERPMRVKRLNNGEILLQDGDAVIAEARSSRIELDVPEPPTYREAEAAAKGYIGFDHHFFPTCFVCGPKRSESDGLRIFPGAVPEKGVMAAPWIPDNSLASETGNVRPEFLWAALDCPGGIAVMGKRFRPMLLGRMVAVIHRRIKPGDRCLVMGWPISVDGRKHLAGSALFTENGTLCGYAGATWIETGIPCCPMNDSP